MKVLFVENRDSFSWNVIDGLPCGRAEVRVRDGRAVGGELGLVEEADVVVIGPGPTDPVRAGLLPIVRRAERAGRPLLGICLGMQLLCEKGLEDGEYEGLGLIPGTALPLAASKIPHMGWNTVEWTGRPPSFLPSAPDGSFFYFVHSFALPEGEFTTGRTTLEGNVFSSMVLKGSVAGFQFHPERSGPEGVALLGEPVRFLRKEGAPQ